MLSRFEDLTDWVLQPYRGALCATASRKSIDLQWIGFTEGKVPPPAAVTAATSDLVAHAQDMQPAQQPGAP
jgi:hypothetical protein